MTSPALFALGTRGSPLALMQANETRLRLAEAHGWDIERIALKVIRTTGDTIQDRPLAEAGGKGLFTKEIDAALLAGAIDAAAHSAKDLPSIMPDGVVIAAYLPREDVRDALISALADSVEGLPRGATFGAASLRRQAQALRLRPDLKPMLPARQCRDEAEQGRVGRGRRNAARTRRPEAARPRSSRSRRARH
jgi:hydroxymethylbilane synthase